jgi:hypothetical protein
MYIRYLYVSLGTLLILFLLPDCYLTVPECSITSSFLRPTALYASEKAEISDHSFIRAWLLAVSGANVENHRVVPVRYLKKKI